MSSPITTYSGRGTTKIGVDQNAHTIVYTQNVPPPKLPGEVKMAKDPLRVIVDDPQDKLDPKSRINLGKLIQIDHNMRVKSLGMIAPQDLAILLNYVDSYTRR